MAYLVLDVSKYNTITDYSAASKAIDGVLIRIGYRGYSAGTLTTDNLFETHYNGFKNTGIKVGYYWFTQAISEAEAIEEANYVYSKIKDKRSDFPVYIDSEYANNTHDGRADSLSANDRTTYIIAFCKRIIELGYRAGVYASDSWFVSQLNWNTLSKKKYSIWDASYSSTKPSRISGYDAWQYTSSGTISGCSGRVDLSYFYNDVANWTKDTSSHDIADCIIDTSKIGEIIYWKGENRPVPEVKNGAGTILNLDSDYSLSYENNINAGEASIIVKGIGEYTGSQTVKFTITPRDISTHASASCGDQDKYYCYNTDNISVTSDIGELVKDTDYYVEISKLMKTNESGYTYYETFFIVYGMNNWKGNIKSINFNTRVYDISFFNFSINDENIVYTGKEIKPVISNKQLMELDKDYTVKYDNNINSGLATAIITGIGDYYGTSQINFNIDNLNFSNLLITISEEESSVKYTGAEIKPKLICSELDNLQESDYAISYSDNINAGTCIITVESKGDNCEGRQTVSFTIKAVDLSTDVTITCGETDEDGNYDLNNLTVAIDSKILIQDKDYTVQVSYSNSEIENSSTASVIITGINNYTGTVNENYQVKNNVIDINSLQLLYTHSYTYTGKEIEIELSYDGLEKDIDYTLSDHNFINAGTYNITITGIGKYSGTKTISITIETVSISDDGIIDYGEPNEDGLYIEDNYTLKINDTILKKDLDYKLITSLIPDENYEFDLLTGIITGIGNYAGMINLEPKPVSKGSYEIDTFSFGLSSEEDIIYNGKAKKPTIICLDNENIVEGKQYSVSYSNNIDAGEATVLIQGLNSFKDSTTEIYFNIKQIDLSTLDIKLKQNKFNYNGDKVKVELINPKTDYEITYDFNFNESDAGVYNVILNGTGNFNFQKELKLEIIAKSLKDSDITISCGDPDEDTGCYDLNNFKVMYKSTELKKDTDYIITKIDVSKFANTDYCDSTVNIEGIGNFKDTTSAVFRTVRTYINIDSLKVKLESDTYIYTGQPITPKPIFNDGVNLVENVDYKLSYKLNINVGTSLLIITGIGDYNDSKTIQFFIDPYDFSDNCTVEINDPDENGYYDIKTINLSVNSTGEKIEEGKDYEKSVLTSISDGKYISLITFNGKGNYTGSFTKSYPTGKVYIDINSVNISSPQESYTYTGSEILFDLVTDLEKDKDYIIEKFSNNINVGTGSVTINGKGDYVGTRTIEFEISKKNISELDITCGEPDENQYYNLDNLSIIYNNKKLVLDIDYNLSIKTSFVDLITYSKLIITGIGNYTGTAEKIYATGKHYIDIANITFSITQDEFNYNGKEHKPEVITDLVEGFDYTLSYVDNINSGVGKVNLFGIGDYSGTKQLTFKINSLDLSSGQILCGSADPNGCYNINNLEVYLYGRTLIPDIDYTYEIINNNDKNNYTISKVSVKGINNYFGTLIASFKTKKVYKDIRKYAYAISQDSYIYNGQECTPKVICEDLRKSDYNVYYENNINAGIAKVVIYGAREFTGTVEIEFKIQPADITNRAYITCGEPDKDGCFDIMNAKVYLDYIDSGYMNINDYEINIERIEEDDFITAKITATGIGNYTGSVSAVFNIEKIEQKDEDLGNDVETSDIFTTGKEVQLKDMTVYPRYCTKKSDISKSGTYYIWNNYVINKRIRITNKKENAKKPGQIIGWVKINDLLGKVGLQIGDAVLVNGKLTKYSDGKGNTIDKSNAIMYVVDLLDKEKFTNYIGLASGINNTRQGWTNEKNIKKI